MGRLGYGRLAEQRVQRGGAPARRVRRHAGRPRSQSATLRPRRAQRELQERLSKGLGSWLTTSRILAPLLLPVASPWSPVRPGGSVPPSPSASPPTATRSASWISPPARRPRRRSPPPAGGPSP